MAYYVYNIQNCTTGGAIQAYTDELGSSNVAPGQTVVKIGNVCYSVISYVGFQQNIPIGALDMTPFTDASLLFPDCTTCTNPTIIVNPPSNTYYKYFLRPCGNVGGAQILATSLNVANLNAYVGGAVKINGTCYEILSSAGTQTTAGDLDTTNGLPFNSCGDCNLPPPPPPGGGSSGTSNNVYIYRIRRCGTTSAAAIIDAYRHTTDLFPGYAVKSVDGLCFEVIDTAGYPIQVAANNVPAGAVDIRNTERVINGCVECTDTVTSGPTGPVQTHWEYDVRQCTDPTNAGRVWATQEFSLGQSIIIGDRCFEIYTKQQIGGAQPSQPFANITNVPKYQNCACELQQGSGISGTQLLTGYICVSGTCQQIIYDPATGQEAYATAAECAQNCGGYPIGTGYNCTNGGCVPATVGQGQYATLLQCQQNCQLIGTLPGGSYSYNLTKCGTSETILGYSTQAIQAGSIIALGSNNCYTITSVQQLTAFATAQGVNLDERPIIQNCNQCPIGDTGYEPTFCEQFPDHPTCDPCYLEPGWQGNCLPECLDCEKCPNDARCITGDPCDNVPEPIEGTLLTTRYIPTGLWTQFAVPEPSQFLYMIHECWRWKYCVCRSQPDPTTIEWQYRVCLCNEEDNNPCPSAGTFIKYECRNTEDPNSPNKFEKWAVYANGSCGTYEQLIETNSVFCGFTPNPNCIQAGSLIRTYCINSDLYGEYHDGKCGKYIEKIQNNSKQCGYIDPPPPPPPPPPDVVNEPPTAAIVYYPIDVQNTLKSLDISSFGAWTGNTPYLIAPSTASLSVSASVSYILPVYDKSPDTSPTCSAELQYKLIYADYEGKGATDLGGLDNQTLTKAMYTQYAHILLPHGQEKFNFDGTDEDYVYIIDINRDRFKQALDPGNWQLTIASASFTLQTGSNSSLSEMMSATYGDNIITLVDEITKTEQRQGAVYLTSKNYNVVVGTIEDGVYTTYVTSSAASASLVRTDTAHIIQSTTTTSNTAIVTGAEAVPFVFSNTTGSFTVNKVQEYYNSIDNTYEYTYSGFFTASFTGSAGPISFTPSKISGSLTAKWYTSYSNNSLGNGKLVLGTFFAQPVQYTSGSKTYNGFLKWGFNSNEGGVYECPSCKEFFVTASQGQAIVSGNITGSAFGYLMADSWGTDSIIDTTELFEPGTGNATGSYSELLNGNILYSIRSNSFGAVYPSAGIIVLSGRKLDELGFATNRSIDRNGYNTYRLFHSMKLVLDRNLTDASGDPLGFYARGVDFKHASRYFITLKNSQLNYSNNPTYVVSGSNGDISTPFLRQNKAYFTSVGLYNAEKELLAIGKVSKPIMSSLTDEALFTVKITQ